jgi:hypothetical protein
MSKRDETPMGLEDSNGETTEILSRVVFRMSVG